MNRDQSLFRTYDGKPGRAAHVPTGPSAHGGHSTGSSRTSWSAVPRRSRVNSTPGGRSRRARTHPRNESRQRGTGDHCAAQAVKRRVDPALVDVFWGRARSVDEFSESLASHCSTPVSSTSAREEATDPAVVLRGLRARGERSVVTRPVPSRRNEEYRRWTSSAVDGGQPLCVRPPAFTVHGGKEAFDEFRW